MHILPAIALALLTPLACAVEPIQVNRPAFGCHEPVVGVQLPKALSNLRKIGGMITEEVVSTEEWDGYQAVEKRLRFKGLSLQVITFTNQPERYILGSLELTSPQWLVAPIRVGQAAKPVLRTLGVKELKSFGSWRFSGETDTLLVEVHHGKVGRLLYECYTG